MQKRYRVMVAEDDFLVTKTISKALKQTFCELVGVATDGLEAVQKVIDLQPDAVLMDIRIPELDGLAATQRIQRECPTAVVILTAHESQELVDQAAEAGASAYLVKPPDPIKIERAVSLAVSRHEEFMELCRINSELEKALAEIKTLKGIIPICSYCKQVRDDEGYWHQVERYLARFSNAEFSHGMCPKCFRREMKKLDVYGFS